MRKRQEHFANMDAMDANAIVSADLGLIWA